MSVLEDYFENMPYFDNRSEQDWIDEEKEFAFDSGYNDDSDDYAKHAKEKAQAQVDYLKNNEIYVENAVFEEQYKLGHMQAIADKQSEDETNYGDDELPEDKYLDMLDDAQFKRNRAFKRSH